MLSKEFNECAFLLGRVAGVREFWSSFTISKRWPQCFGCLWTIQIVLHLPFSLLHLWWHSVQSTPSHRLFAQPIIKWQAASCPRISYMAIGENASTQVNTQKPSCKVGQQTSPKRYPLDFHIFSLTATYPSKEPRLRWLRWLQLRRATAGEMIHRAEGGRWAPAASKAQETPLQTLQLSKQWAPERSWEKIQIPLGLEYGNLYKHLWTYIWWLHHALSQ